MVILTLNDAQQKAAILFYMYMYNYVYRYIYMYIFIYTFMLKASIVSE